MGRQMRKTSICRKKTETKRIECKEAREVCFSKRRQGLFKKASELSILCGAVVGIVVFSPTGRAYSFGSPSIDAVIKCFLTLGARNVPTMYRGIYDISGMGNTVRMLTLVCEELEKGIKELMEVRKVQKKKLEEMEQESGGSFMNYCMTANLDALGLDEVEEIYKKLKSIHDAINGKTNQAGHGKQATTLDVDVSFASGAYGIGGSMDRPNGTMSDGNKLAQE